ncbi:MAG: AAA family ATPase, partial [Armatimonadetes bacterium]|nr:AAA family ATPase [Armatimonadota bacterium]
MSYMGDNNGGVLIQEITLRNVLSYGPKTEPIALGRLNVLIGPNGSGKSNLIEAIGLLRSAPDDLRVIVSKGGGINEWIWKGMPGSTASIDAVVSNPAGNQPVRHVLEFREEKQAFRLEDERIENREPYEGMHEPYFYYRYQHGRPVLLNVSQEQRRLASDTVEPDISILKQRREAELYPVLFYLGTVYEKIRVYREWTFGSKALFREPQQADMRNDRLEEGFSNLGLFLNRMRGVPQAKKAILTALRDLYEGLDDFDVSIEGGTVQVFFTEGAFTIPAKRLSDGTLRYLCLLAILCDPKPPPVVCIEEPELGLHP